MYKGRKKIWLQTNEELAQLVGKELSHGKAHFDVTHTNDHWVDCSGNSARRRGSN